MLEWLLILYIDDSREYIGTFESCAHATQYFQECVKGDHKSWSTACLHQNYVRLPENFTPKYPTCK
jgi:hypothetical protein